MTRLLTVLVLLPTPALLAAPVPEEAKAPALYFPTRVGAKWVYERNRSVLESAVVAAVEQVGREHVVSRAGDDGNPQQYAKVVVSPAGLRQDRDVATGQLADVWLLKVPFRSGDSWPVPEQAGGGKRTVYGPELVELPAGRFQTAKVVHERPGGSRMTSWYAPGVGEVKRVERRTDGTETVTRSLLKFTSVKQ
jgi:hypothetical protein